MSTFKEITKLLDGKSLSEKILLKIRKQVLDMPNKPGLAVVLIGNNPASELYVRLKRQAAEKCGISFHVYRFDCNYQNQDIIECIEFLNKDEEVHGIIVQLPLPKGFDTDKIIATISPDKDVDGFHPINLKMMAQGHCQILPPLAGAAIKLAESADIPIINKKIVILCNHKIMSAPFECVWGKDNEVRTLTTADKNWKEETKQADVLFVAVGKAEVIKKNMIKKGAIIIDAGINKVQSSKFKVQNKSKILNLKSKIVGDVDFKNVLPIVSYISPVPGGVGPMTVAMLLKNVLELANGKVD